MPQALHSRRGNEKQVHEVAMVRNQVIHLNFAILMAGIGRHEPASGTNHEAVSVQQRYFRLRRLEEIDVTGVCAGLCIPPGAVDLESTDSHDQRNHHDNP